MDATDELILQLLQANGRRSNREIAKELEIPEKQIAARIRQMLASDDMRILTVTDIFAAGFDFMLFIGVEVAERPADEVAEDLAAMPEVLSVMLTMGSCDIEIVVVAEDHARLTQFVTGRLSRVAGIRSFALSLGLDMFKYTTVMGPLIRQQRPQQPMRIADGGPVDATDKAIIEELWSDARSTNQAIADRLGISESAVRARVNALRQGNLIRITAMRNMRIDSGEVFASIGVEVEGRDIARVAAELAGLPDAGFVASVLGRYDILVMGLMGSASELSKLLTSRIERLDGVRKVHTSQVMSFVKYDHHWSAILD
jgi:Lrp/AsnC family transcriptional regulator, leucine-responsive regulatory protein